MQIEFNSIFPLLYSVAGFRYCDLLLAAAERAAWNSEGGATEEELSSACCDVADRARQTLQWAEQECVDILSVPLDHLTLARAALYAAVLSSDSSALDSFLRPTSPVQQAVSGLRRAGQQQYLPLGLLTRAWCFVAAASAHRRLTDDTRAQELMRSAQSDLDEAWEIAARGPMPLFQADIHLYRARLFGRAHLRKRLERYPWESPEHDLAEARRLIEKHGYGRRKQEIEDAETSLK